MCYYSYILIPYYGEKCSQDLIRSTVPGHGLFKKGPPPASREILATYAI